jgi:hypothetical protein
MNFPKLFAVLAISAVLLACSGSPSSDSGSNGNSAATADQLAPRAESTEQTEFSAEPSDAAETSGDAREDRIAALQQRLREQQSETAFSDSPNAELVTDPMNTNRFRLTISPYNHFTDSAGFLNFTNVTLQNVQQQLGDAPVLVRMSRQGAPLRREVRVYFPYEEDSTGLYLFFRNEVVVAFQMDEFNGLSNPAIGAFFDF